uniref:Anion exchange protein n=1 Tax=Geotrypetes seraphini TaxID=260995 RepID=A0A6P8REV0_GEOSA|nr:anion exchange protein 3 isoform X6 [Geotrypetes seraphini]
MWIIPEEGDESTSHICCTMDTLAYEDFEEFALDFEDYDLWEVIKSHLGHEGDPSCHRFENNPGLRRHLVKKASRNRITRSSQKMVVPSSMKKKKADRRPHEVFVELNELIHNKNQELQWQETARWIKFEEDVEEDTSRWGKPHVASLSFRSLLELRKTITHGAVLLDLEQTTLPGIAHLVVETMIISDQIKAEDRANVLRALLLKHSHPSDERDNFFPRNHSSSTVSSVLGEQLVNRAVDTCAPLVKEVHLELNDTATKEKLLLHGAEGQRSKYVKLMEKIPEDAEATVVLVGCVPFLEQPTMAFVRLNEAVLLESVLEIPIPVRFIFVLLGPIQCNMDYHEIGRSISTLMSDKHFHEAAYMADDRQDLLNAINEFLDCSIVIPPLELEGKDLLKSVTSFQKELLRKRKAREQKSLQKTNGEKTDGLMGVSELLVSTSVLGIIFSLLAAQPLLIIGFSGPLMVFEEAFYKFCQSQGMEYLTGRVWIGLWLFIFIFIMVAAEGSFLVRYISPFTQEIFAFLISLIFIYETFYKLYKVFQEHPLRKSYPLDLLSEGNSSSTAAEENSTGMKMQPNTALLSLILMLGTFFIAFFLRRFRNSRFLGGKARRIIGDFGIPISTLVMVLLDYVIKDTYTQKLNVPSGLSVTAPQKRGWFIHPLGTRKTFPIWMMFASAIPALLVCILIFMETQITTLIVSKKERKLVKGSGFHLDLLLIGALGGICSLFGLPWLTATTVRSVTHVNALTVMNKAIAPGEKPKIEEVKEQRLTGVFTSVLVGLSIVMGSVLRRIPLAVLFGIFLYMGITSLSGIQICERMLLIFMPSKHHPDHIYVLKVKTWRMNLFTCIQLACIMILWVVKSTVASLAFPFLLILTVPLRRFLLPRLFQERELKAVATLQFSRSTTWKTMDLIPAGTGHIHALVVTAVIAFGTKAVCCSNNVLSIHYVLNS